MHRFAVFVAFATLCLIIAGALVTSNEAGLAVPDWPLSYGSLTPPWVGNIRFEHGHRVIASTVGMLTIALAAWLWRREPRRWVQRLGFIALAAVVAQGILGGLTVLFFLPAPISVAHACLAQAFFCMTVTIALATGRRWQQPVVQLPDPQFPTLGHLATITTASIYLQLVLGAALRHKASGIIPHLAGAAVVATLVMWTVYRALSRHSDQPVLMRPAGLLGTLLFLQLILGAASYMVREATRDAPQPLFVMVVITVAHVATGALTLAASLWLTLESRRLLAPAATREGTVTA
jgi:cytochrome c oxidase assembly protein subunit 15